jgi:hypothetical protein
MAKTVTEMPGRAILTGGIAAETLGRIRVMAKDKDPEVV